MTTPTTGTQAPGPNLAKVAYSPEDGQVADRLSQVVTGNDNLITQPGLALALVQGNATPQQAQAINEFVGGLNAEQKVRTAAAAGQKIPLTDQEQNALSAMGVNYASVIYTPQDALTDLKTAMAKQGMEPVLDANGNVKTDGKGNPLAQAIPQPKKHSDGLFDSWGGFFHGITHNDVTNIAGNVVIHGDASWQDPHSEQQMMMDAGHPHGLGDAVLPAAQEGWNWVDATATASRTPVGSGSWVAQDLQNDDLMKSLGYDPNSFFSRQAFASRGYQHTDTTNLADAWDQANPHGLYGMSGTDAVTQAEIYAADPTGYAQRIENDPTLTPQEVAAKLEALNSQQFSDLVQRVNASSATIGNEIAHSVGIDPIKHPDLYKTVSLGTDLAASFFLDPLALGLNVGVKLSRASTAINGLTDSEGIMRTLTASAPTVAQSRGQNVLRDMVQLGADNRQAIADGDKAAQAAVQAKAAANPLGGLLSTFTSGEDMILGTRSASELEAAHAAGTPLDTFVLGKGEPLDTYDKAVEYIASKGALVRLGYGKAPIDVSVMPGTTSSYGFMKLRQAISGWSAYHTASRTDAAVESLISRANADPTLGKALFDNKVIGKVLPTQDDAVDVLTGRVLAAQSTVATTKGATRAAAQGELASARRALADHSANVEAAAPYQATDATVGYLRGNQLRYGRFSEPSTALGRLASIYTLGTLQRAKVVFTRLTNMLPTNRTVDVNDAAAAETIRRTARTYLTSGDANLLAARWTTGTADTRRAIVSGLKDAIFQASGMARTASGQAWKQEQDALPEVYNTAGREWVDSNGRAAAQWPGQVRQKFTMPNFGEVHRAAAKVGLYEGTMGRLFDNKWYERMLSQWRVAALLSPVTYTRAYVESWLNAGAEKMFMSGLAAKAVARSEGKLVGDIDRTRLGNMVANAPALKQVGRLYTKTLMRYANPDEVEALINQADDLFYQPLVEQSLGHWAQEVDPSGAFEASKVAEAGLHPREITYDTKKGFDAILRQGKGYELTDELKGMAGVNAYTNNLMTRVNAAPDLAKRVLDRIEDPENTSVNDVIAEIEKTPAMRDSVFGKRFRSDDGQMTDAIQPSDITLGKQQFAQGLVDDMAQLLTGRNGKFQQNVADYIREHNAAPNADWLMDNLTELDRPAQMVRPIMIGTPPTMKESGSFRDAVGSVMDSLTQNTGTMYRHVVERPIQRNITSPLYAAAYAKSRVALEPFKQKLMEGGLSDEAAERATQEIAAQQGWNRVAIMVDDPRIKAQMDVVGRGFFAFSRATTTMIRRWGQTFWKNPAAARRTQLAWEAAQHSGLIYKDETGQWDFRFPGSGVAQELLFSGLSHIPGLASLAKFPTADFQGRVNSIIPGSNNPFQYNTNPLITIGGHEVEKLFPDQQEIFDEVDQTLNGQAGANKGLLDTLMPRLMSQFSNAELDESRNSILSSAMVSSLYNLAAAGQIPPDGASPADQEKFIQQLRIQTKSVLFLRFLMGTVSPALLTTPDGENSASAPDFAFAQRGVQNLHDEYRTILNDVNGDIGRATAIWTALHPDKTVYEASSTQASTSHAEIADTQQAYLWMAKNDGFIKKYANVAGYFIPAQQPGDKFNIQAYEAQLAMGLRERKTPQEFMDAVNVAAGANTYYAVETKYKADEAAAKAAGDTALATSRRNDWLAWSKQWKTQHPSFAAHLESTTANVIKAQQQMSNLATMVKEGDVPGGPQMTQAISGLLDAYNGYKSFVNAHPGTANGASAQRALALSQLQDYMTQLVQAEPQLAGLYAGVLRPLTGFNLDSLTS